MLELLLLTIVHLQGEDVEFMFGPEKDRWGGHIGMTLGFVARSGLYRSFDGDGRIHVDVQPPAWPVSMAFEFGMAGLTPDLDKVSGADVWKKDVEDDAQVADLDLGVRWTTTWAALGSARPMLAAGAAYFMAELNGLVSGELVSRYDHSTAVGPWVEGALTWDLDDTWCVGARLRWDYAPMDLFGGKGNVGGFHASIVAEARF